MKKLVFIVTIFLVVLIIFGILFFLPFASYDEDWMVGKTLAEVCERYGPPDRKDWYIEAFIGYSEGRSSLLQINLTLPDKDSIRPEEVMYNPEAIVSSTKRFGIDPEEWGDYNPMPLFLNWAKEKSLDELLATKTERVFEITAEPVYCIPEKTVVYTTSNEYYYGVLSLEQEENGTYFVAEVSMERDVASGWQPWDSALFGVEVSSDEKSTFPWLWIALPVGAVVIAGGAAFVLFRKKRRTEN